MRRFGQSSRVDKSRSLFKAWQDTIPAWSDASDDKDPSSASQSTYGTVLGT